MKSLETYVVQEVQTLKETMVNRFQALEDHRSDISEGELQGTGHERVLKFSTPFRVRGVFPVSVNEKPETKKHPKGGVAYQWEPISMKDLKGIKEAVVSYGMHSPYVKQLIESWARNNKVTPKDWDQLISAVLENSSQLEWRALWREEAKALELQGLKKGYKASQDKILGEGIYSDPETPAAYDEHILSLCSTAALNAWDKVHEVGEKIESYVKIRQGPREKFTSFLERLSRAVQLEVADIETREVLI